MKYYYHKKGRRRQPLIEQNTETNKICEISVQSSVISYMCACTYIISLCNQKVPNNVGNEDSNIIIMRK